MTELLSQWRFSILLAALVSNILLAPLLGHIPAFIAFTLLILIIVFTLGNNRFTIITYTILSLTALVLTWLQTNDNSNLLLNSSSHFFSFLTLILAFALIIKNIFSSQTVTLDTIASSLCAYLLLGLAFAFIYALIDTAYPSSFTSSLTNEATPLTFNHNSFDKIYFSFITLLTVGYGDIVPTSDAAKLTTIIEGFIGQIYIVVLIARLVGMHVSQNSNYKTE